MEGGVKAKATVTLIITKNLSHGGGSGAKPTATLFTTRNSFYERHSSRYA